MTPEQLRAEAERAADAIWNRAKLPGDGAVWIADAIVRVAEKYAESRPASWDLVRIPENKLAEALAENARLAASDGYVDHAITTLIQECDAARAEVARLRETIVELQHVYARIEVLTMKLHQCTCRDCYRCDECDSSREEIDTLAARRVELLTNTGVVEQCTEGEATDGVV